MDFTVDHQRDIIRTKKHSLRRLLFYSTARRVRHSFEGWRSSRQNYGWKSFSAQEGLVSRQTPLASIQVGMTDTKVLMSSRRDYKGKDIIKNVTFIKPVFDIFSPCCPGNSSWECPPSPTHSPEFIPSHSFSFTFWPPCQLSTHLLRSQRNTQRIVVKAILIECGAPYCEAIIMHLYQR